MGKPRWPEAGVAVALAALVAYSAWERWSQLAASPFPLGVDGYFYPVQLRSLLETGQLHYPAAPLAFWLLLPFAAATDPIVGAKLGAAIYCALAALPAYAIGKRLGGSRGAGLLAAALLTTSAGSAYLTNEFVKNGIGITVALVAIWLLLRALESPTLARRALALVALVAAIATHKMAAGFVLVVGVPTLLAGAAARGRLRGRRLLYVIVALVAFTIVVAILGLAFPERFLSSADAQLVANVVTTDAHWDAPVLATASGTMTLGHEALAGAIFAILAILAGTARGHRIVSRLSELLPRGHVDDGPLTRRPAGDAMATRALLVLAIAIGLPWLAVADEQALGFRLRIAAFVPMALVAAVLANRLLFRVTHREAILVVLAVLLATRKPGERTDGAVITHPALVAGVQAMAGAIPDGDVVVVSERHILFMVAWYTRASARMRPETVPSERRWRLVPLAFVEAGSALDDALYAARATPGIAPPRGLHPWHPNGLVLIPEATWQWMLARLPPGAPARWRKWRTI